MKIISCCCLAGLSSLVLKLSILVMRVSLGVKMLTELIEVSDDGDMILGSLWRLAMQTSKSADGPNVSEWLCDA